MADINSSIAGTQSGGFTTKDKVLNQTIGRQSSIKSGASTPQNSGGGNASNFFNPEAGKATRTGDWITDFFQNFSSGLAFENGIDDVAYDF